MIRTWAALARLAASWLPGLGYFEPVSWPAWAVMVTAAVLLLARGKLTSGQWPVASGRSWQSPASLATDHRPLATFLQRSWRCCLRPG